MEIRVDYSPQTDQHCWQIYKHLLNGCLGVCISRFYANSAKILGSCTTEWRQHLEPLQRCTKFKECIAFFQSLQLGKILVNFLLWFNYKATFQFSMKTSHAGAGKFLLIINFQWKKVSYFNVSINSDQLYVVYSSTVQSYIINVMFFIWPIFTLKFVTQKRLSYLIHNKAV